jgi:hypothetical protein
MTIQGRLYCPNWNLNRFHRIALQGAIALALLCPDSRAAESISLTGKVMDAYANGLAGAKVHLQRNNGEAISDASGRFALNATPVLPSRMSGYSGSSPQFANGFFNLTIREPFRVSVDLFTLDGRHVATTFNQHLLPGGYSIDPFGGIRTTQLYIARMCIGSREFSYRVPLIDWKRSRSRQSPELAAGARGICLKKSAAVFDTLQVSLDGFDTASIPVENPAGYYEVVLTSKGSRPGRSDFYMSPTYQRVKVAMPSASSIDFNTVLNTNGYRFPTPFSAEVIDRLNLWSRNLLQNNPFKGFATGEVPWIDLHASQENDPYIFLTQEQLAYLFLVTIFDGTLTLPDGNPLVTGLSYARHYNDGEDNYWMFTVLCYLTKIMQDESCKTTYVGCALGGYSQEEGMAAITAMGMDSRAMAPLNVCYFDESDIKVQSPTHPLSAAWCLKETSEEAIGGSFHSIDIPGQCVVDIGGACYGGGTNCPGCRLAGSQDECLPAFYTETIGFSFFMKERTTNNGLICTPRALSFFGVRCYVEGINGSHKILGGWCGKPMRPAGEFLSSTIQVNVGGDLLRVYDHSMVFVASQLNGALPPDFANYLTKERKLCATGRSGVGTYDFAGYCDQLTSIRNCTSPLMDIGKWYGAFTPTSYHADVSNVVSSLFRRIGTFNWGAGVWWGDVQEYFMISWLGTSFLDNVALDYYIFSSPCENSGVQCSMLTGTQCTDCYARSMYNVYPVSCSQTGVDGVYNKAKDLSAGQFFSRLKAAIRYDGHLFDVF